MKQLLTTIALVGIAFTSNAQFVQCKGTTVKGVQCRKAADSTGYCSIHNPNKHHCSGTTKAGKPCKLLPEKGSTYCKWHQQQVHNFD